MSVNENTKVAIISVNFNNCSGLKRTIESVSPILHKCRNVVHLIQDGGSSDASYEIAKSEGYSECDIQKTIITQKDNCLWEGMFNGIRNADVDYIHLLNSGDTIVDTDNYVSLIKTLPYLLPDVLLFEVSLAKGSYLVPYVHRGFDRVWLKNGLMPPHPGMVVRKELLLRHNAFAQFDLDLPHDYWFCVRLLKERDLKVVHSNCHTITMEDGGLSQSRSYIIKRLFRQTAVLRKEGYNKSLVSILFFKALKYFFSKKGDREVGK